MQIDKKSLRLQALAKRQAIAEAQAASASQLLAAHLLALLPPDAAVIAGYCAVRGEMDVLPALAMLAARDQEVCLPAVMDSGELAFRRWAVSEPLEAGRYGIAAPLADAPLVTPDIVLVPLLAFDRAGHRLGYGAGYYDRAIRRLREGDKSVVIIGAAYAVQEVDAIPAEPHDERLDWVVTERGAKRIE